MAKQVLCANFRQEQFVPARQVRTVLSVYVASREERSACNGLGCAVKDLMTGEEKRMKISELMKMRLQFPNGKPVKAYSLKGGHTYTMIGVPAQQNFGVFIVPRGESSYEFLYKDRTLSPMSVILFDGKNTRVIDYRTFRKMFIMLPNRCHQVKCVEAEQAWQIRWATVRQDSHRHKLRQLLICSEDHSDTATCTADTASSATSDTTAGVPTPTRISAGISARSATPTRISSGYAVSSSFTCE